MKIHIDLHNPLRGVITCEHCNTPIENGRDEWHNEFAKEVAEVFGETFDGHRTDPKWYPAMIKKFAERLAGKTKYALFCKYCGGAVQQARISRATGKPVPPGIYFNNHKAVKRWAEELEIDYLPVDDYQKFSHMAYQQEKDSYIPGYE